MGRCYNPTLLGAAVNQLAHRLGETAGLCAACGRPVRLMPATGLVPPHQPAGRRGNGCPGAERLPGADPLGVAL